LLRGKTALPGMSQPNGAPDRAADAPPTNGSSPPSAPTANGTGAHSRVSGWDGKLRVNRQATLVNPEALSDPEYSDEDAPKVEEIEADEGM